MLPELGAEFFVALIGVVLADLVLAGDNAVVIALAARNLPAHLRRKAVFWGAAAAIMLRGALTVVAVYLLKEDLPFVQLVGGLLLLWIAWKLATEEEAHDEDDIVAAATIRGAVQTILIADVVMSIDNVLAVAAIARNDIWLVIFGLLLSIPIIMGGATLILRIIDRFPIIVLIGAGLIAYVGVELMIVDPNQFTSDFFHDLFPNLWVERLTAITIAAAFALFAWSRRGRGGDDTIDRSEDDSEARLMVEGSDTDD